MGETGLDLATIRWALALAIGFPAALVALGELIPRLERAGRSVASTLRIVRLFVLPTLAAYLLMDKVIGLPPRYPGMLAVETLLWIFLIHAALSFAKDVVFASAREDSWQAGVPKLVIDLVRLVLVLIGGAVVLSAVWGLDLGNVAAALGVGSIILGLALQEPLGNVFAGLMLMLERPFRVGDWLRAEGNLGRVVEINWRAVHVETVHRELVVIPNSAISKNTFLNASRPHSWVAEAVSLAFSFDDPPNKVKRVLMDCARRTEGVMEDPAPQVFTLEYKDSGIEYRVVLRVASVEALEAARDAFMTRVWYAARRHGLTIPYPVEEGFSREEAEARVRAAFDPSAAARCFPQFPLGDREGLRSGHQTFARGERVVSRGDRSGGLYLVLSGEASIAAPDSRGLDREIALVSTGEYFGEGSTLAGPSEVTVTAVEDLDVLVIDAASLGDMLDRSPRLSREIGAVMDVRRRAAQAARAVGNGGAG